MTLFLFRLNKIKKAMRNEKREMKNEKQETETKSSFHYLRLKQVLASLVLLSPFFSSSGKTAFFDSI